LPRDGRQPPAPPRSDAAKRRRAPRSPPDRGQIDDRDALQKHGARISDGVSDSESNTLRAVPEISLIPFTEKHLEDHERMLDDPEIIRFTRVPAFRPPNYLRSWLAGYELGRADGSREIFAIVTERESYLGFAAAARLA